MVENYDFRKSGPVESRGKDSYMFVSVPEDVNFNDLVSMLRDKSISPRNMEDFITGGEDLDNFFYHIYELSSPQEWLDVHPEYSRQRHIAIRIPESAKIPGYKIYDGMCEDSKIGLLVVRYLMLKGEREIIDLREAEFIEISAR